MNGCMTIAIDWRNTTPIRRVDCMKPADKWRLQVDFALTYKRPMHYVQANQRRPYTSPLSMDAPLMGLARVFEAAAAAASRSSGLSGWVRNSIVLWRHTAVRQRRNLSSFSMLSNVMRTVFQWIRFADSFHSVLWLDREWHTADMNAEMERCEDNSYYCRMPTSDGNWNRESMDIEVYSHPGIVP
jgi:hypothetical protein